MSRCECPNDKCGQDRLFHAHRADCRGFCESPAVRTVIVAYGGKPLGSNRYLDAMSRAVPMCEACAKAHESK